MKAKKSIFLISFLSLAVALSAQAAYEEKPQEAMPFNVYTEQNATTNHFVPSGWMGDYGALRITQACKDNPHSGLTCIKINYTGEPTQGAGWVGLFWQNPENNWGSKDGGFNLSGASKLTFWARGEAEEENIEFKVGGITGAYPDSDTAGIGPIKLSKEWKQYTIDLQGLELFYISGGFVIAASRIDNPGGFAIYIDDIIYE
ncbi:MAG: hypothetical protein HQ558_05910 [Candidatus Omnitrophica bacterium]|nr:hypothetical protein [Candidatus Omnitrophota bacterium]